MALFPYGVSYKSGELQYLNTCTPYKLDVIGMFRVDRTQLLPHITACSLRMYTCTTCIYTQNMLYLVWFIYTMYNISFGNPRPIPWPTSGLGCNGVLDLRLCITFCDAVVLFTLYTNLHLIQYILKIKSLSGFNVFKQSLIYTMHNLYPSFVYWVLVIAQNWLFWIQIHWAALRHF